MRTGRLLDEIEAAVFAHHVFSGNTREESVTYTVDLLESFRHAIPLGRHLDVQASAEALVDQVAGTVDRAD